MSKREGARNLQSKLRPIINYSLTDQVETKLLELFKKEDLRNGDAIPKENELCEAMGVSRTVIREALTRLKTIGLIESKKNKGMILTEPDLLIGLDKLLQPKILSEETLQDMFEMRLVLEMGIAELLFARIKPSDIADLKAILKTEKDYPALFEMDFEARFHGRIYEIARNNTLVRFQSMLLPIFKYVHDKGLKLKDEELPKNYVTHALIVKAIETGNPEKYRDAMKRHLKIHFDKTIKMRKLLE
ncbi:MAG: FadR family transcriptional regulator [Chitinophagaceae bacterium]|nr:FadR family transcriptional regulator [Chitinophagaceae bacterium]MCA6453087.1 FadR family transcriptional regulator [Chitinophagaceae bacterium]MCA6454683.1 FadR family transcriptional regulator [Chitinophagaceae bacterium]MCA6458062.1 FadR family transcriptional regulator [Chitinophagaceae bacterium]MEA3425064.1 FCD domain-containing protein [Bacteroidota bacterium]